MRALTLENGELRFRTEYELPEPGPKEALLRMRVAGICGTDLALVSGYKGGYKGVLGHEYVAEIVKAPDQPQWVGQRVVGEINTTCGNCDRCRRGLTTHCARRRVLGILDWDGVFSDYFLSPIANLYPLPDSVSDSVAVFTEPLAAAYAALRDLPADVGDQVIIFGAGRLGQLIALVFKQAGYDPLLITRHPQQVAVASHFGIHPAAKPAASAYDIAIDATGDAAALPEILLHLRPRGVLILKTTATQPSVLHLSSVVVDELRLIGSRCGPYPQAVAALATGTVDPTPLISATYPLSQALVAFQHAARPGVFKVLLQAEPSPLGL